MSWAINLISGDQVDQVSFIGGKPRLPIGRKIPVCQLCGQKQTFFFQVSMPEGALWSGSTLAVYQCTKCAHEDYFIPEMLSARLARADIPKGFLAAYQRNFSFEVFPTELGEVVSEYEEAIVFSELHLSEGNGLGSFGKLAGDPLWLLEDESPATYGGDLEMGFLLQVGLDFQFRMTSGAAPQIKLNIMGGTQPSPHNYYRLFLSNALYLFGTKSGEQAVYAITQVD